MIVDPARRQGKIVVGFGVGVVADLANEVKPACRLPFGLSITAMNPPATDSTSSPIARLDVLERRLQTLFAFQAAQSLPIVEGTSILPPVGIVSEFVDPEHFKTNAYCHRSDALARAASDKLPLPALQNREDYCPNHFDFWLYGFEDYSKVRDACAAHGVSLDRARFLDFGGSTGRVFRHVFTGHPEAEVWSSDFNLASVRWNLQNYPIGIRSFLNTTLPHLSVADGTFDVVTAFSVFTHIDQLELAWLLELRRITKPTGLLYITIHDEETWADTPNVPQLLGGLRRDAEFTEAELAGPMPAERLAYHWGDAVHYNSNVYESQAYIRRVWGRFFDVLDIKSMQHWHQARVLLRPR